MIDTDLSAQDQQWMELALECAHRARMQDEVPIGAVAVFENRVIATAWNQSIALNDPCAHAEILVLRKAGQALNNYRLPGVSIYVTLEPCAMCAYAMVHARIERLVYATTDPRTGAAGSQLDLLNNPSFNHKVTVSSGLLQDEASQLLKGFFREKRKK